MRVSFFGHASMSVELGGTVVLTDPILRGRVAMLRWTAALPAPAQWQQAEAVLISHLHLDHCDLPSLRRIGRSRMVVVPAGAEPVLRRRGFVNVIGLRAGQATMVGDVELTAVPAAHDGRRYPGGPDATPIGYLMTSAGGCVYFAGDTDLFGGMQDVAGNCDLALLPVWGWGRSIGDGHLDPARAAEAVARIRPALAVPIHWGAFTPIWDPRPPRPDPPREFAAQVRARKLDSQVRVLAPGTAMRWPP